MRFWIMECSDVRTPTNIVTAFFGTLNLFVSRLLSIRMGLLDYLVFIFLLVTSHHYYIIDNNYNYGDN
jgi:hypothetical protein